MFSFLSAFAHASEMRESKDEILVGEIVRSMARRGWPAISFRANDDRQIVTFKTLNDPVLFSVRIILDRRTGQGVLSQAVLGSKATLQVAAEVRNFLADPDDLLNMYKTDLQNIFKLPVMGGIKLNHELNSVFARTNKVISIDDHINKGDKSAAKLEGLLGGTIDALKEKLAPYKKA